MATAAPSKTKPSFVPLSDRIARFRDASRKRGAVQTPSRRAANMTRAFFHLYAKRPLWERYARSMAYAIENEPVYTFDDERLVGMLYQTGPGVYPHISEYKARWEPYDPHKQMRKRQQAEVDPYMAAGGSWGHIGWRWDLILQRGIIGHMEVMREHLAHATDVKAKRLYKGALIVWRSVLRWNDKHVAALRDKAEHAVGDDRRQLDDLIAICRRVPCHPARTFREAVQAFHMQHLVVMFENPFGGNGPGRADYFLWPYLERDLAAGRITQDDAKEWVDELLIRFHERLQHADGWVEGLMVGGTGPDGTTTVNPLSHMIIHSFAQLDQTHPSVYPRISPNGPGDFLDLCALYLLRGHNRAQIYNDDACMRAIVASGTTVEDAAMYMGGGCMEISVQGMNCDLNFAAIHNVAKTLELLVNGGIDMLTGERRIAHTRVLTDYRDFDDLYATFETELEREYGQMVRTLDIASECYARFRPTYLLSSLMGDCLERGRDQQDGGARYHECGFSPLGITAAADSLTALKRAVFDQGFVAASDMLAALRANFVGHEDLQRCLARLPRFGVEDTEADRMCDRVLRTVCTAAVKPKTRFGGQLKPMVFNFVWTPMVSKELGARCDGSRAGDLIGHGTTPGSRAMTKGITAAINSSTSLDYDVVSGGATTMWDMDDQWIDFPTLKALLKTFLARGGMIFQGNTTSVQELQDAIEHPDKYPNLIVRVGGYSARFTTLGRELQTEIVNRRRHSG